MTDTVSESKSQRSRAPTPQGRVAARLEPGLVAESAQPEVLHQHSPLANPMGEGFDYAEEFKRLDVEALKQDVSR